MSTLEVKAIQAPTGYDLVMPAGHILQVVHGLSQTIVTTTSNSAHAEHRYNCNNYPKFTQVKF